MRVFQLLLCCAILAGCMRNPSPLPTSLSSGDAVTLHASQNFSHFDRERTRFQNALPLQRSSGRLHTTLGSDCLGW